VRRTTRSAGTLTALLAALLAGAVVLAACGADDPAPPAAGGTATGDRIEGQVVVFAAASLTEAFTELGAAFEAEHPGTDVVLGFAASSELVTQLLEGAPADVYASADRTNMARLTDAGGARDEPVVFATNRSAIVVAPGNPLGISGVADLTDPDLIVVTCAPQVPCGSYATRIFASAGVDVVPDSYEENVKAVVTKVALGEADAGIAYVTDVRAAGATVAGVEIPAEDNVLAEYPMVLTADAPNPAGGRAFVELVLGPTGQAILAGDGFTSP
jgi:molybdate transport system substrate-binding protein